MPRLKAKSPYVWNGKPTAPGDEHDADERETQILTALQWAERVPTLGERVADVADRAMTAISARTGRPKRQYRRRDMRSAG